MRGVWMLGTLAVALVAPTTPALGAQGTTPSGLIQDVNVTQTSTQAGQLAGAMITTALGRAGDSRPSATVGITVTLPSGMVRNTGSFVTCEGNWFEGECPPGSEIGTGSASLDARPIITDPITAQIVSINRPNDSVQSFVSPSIGPIFLMPGTPLGTGSIAFVVPPILTLPSVPNAVITQLTLTFESGYLTNPPECPAGGWEWVFDFSYEGGESVRIPVNVACTGGPSPPPSGNRNRAKACKTERVTLGENAFATKYGTNRNGRNAFGKCVSGKNR
jgi:hypothetical protein